jgi:hypothetical protein
MLTRVKPAAAAAAGQTDGQYYCESGLSVHKSALVFDLVERTFYIYPITADLWAA